MIWFTSDLHFGHKNVIEFCKRPFSSVEDMERGLISNWNSCVSDGDIVYILGDMFFCGVKKIKEIMPQLNGKKHLVLGNHDWGKVKPRRAEELGFESVTQNSEIGFEFQDGKVLMLKLCHFPYSGDHTKDVRYLEYRPNDVGGILLHGHVHEAWKVRGRQINVGVDVWDYKPVSQKQIEEIVQSIGGV